MGQRFCCIIFCRLLNGDINITAQTKLAMIAIPEEKEVRKKCKPRERMRRERTT